jgi:hypothetical protein
MKAISILPTRDDVAASTRSLRYQLHYIISKLDSYHELMGEANAHYLNDLQIACGINIDEAKSQLHEAIKVLNHVGVRIPDIAIRLQRSEVA